MYQEKFSVNVDNKDENTKGVNWFKSHLPNVNFSLPYYSNHKSSLDAEITSNTGYDQFDRDSVLIAKEAINMGGDPFWNAWDTGPAAQQGVHEKAGYFAHYIRQTYGLDHDDCACDTKTSGWADEPDSNYPRSDQWTCPRCDQINERDDEHCSHCGTERPIHERPQEYDASVKYADWGSDEKAGVEPDKTVKCPECGGKCVQNTATGIQYGEWRCIHGDWQGDVAKSDKKSHWVEAGSPAAAARKAKEADPSKFCANSKCLYRTDEQYCPNHQQKTSDWQEVLNQPKNRSHPFGSEEGVHACPKCGSSEKTRVNNSTAYPMYKCANCGTRFAKKTWHEEWTDESVDDKDYENKADLKERGNAKKKGALQKGSPYPKNDDEVDHSAPGHHLPAKVNEIYNAIKREHPEYSKEKAMSIAWSRSGESKESAGSIPPAPGLEFYSPDEVAETLPGISEQTYGHLWQLLSQPGTPQAPMGGDRHDPYGEHGAPMVEDPASRHDVMSQPGGGSVVDIWNQLTPQEQQEINAAYEKEHAGWDTGEFDQGKTLPPQGETQILGAKKVKSNWHVISIGEAQLNGGVGMLDTPNPDANAAFADVGQGSPEQREAVQTWVNIAVGKLNSNPDFNQHPELLARELETMGCPAAVVDEVVGKAINQPVDPLQQQPQQAADSQIADQGSAMAEQPQPQVMRGAKVKIGSLEAEFIGAYTDAYDRHVAKIKTADGLFDVAFGDIEVLPEVELDRPLDSISKFKATIEESDGTKASVLARITNMKTLRKLCRVAINESDFEDQAALDTIDRDAQVEIINLTDSLKWMGDAVKNNDFKYDAFGIESSISTGTIDVSHLDRILDEHPAIVVARLGDAATDPGAIEYAAKQYISSYTTELPPEQREAVTNRFVRSALYFTQDEKTVPQQHTAAADNAEGPAESLFL